MTLLMMAGESNAQEEEFWAEEVVLSRDDDDEGEESEDEDWEDEEEEDVDREELDSILTALEDGDYTEKEELSDDGGCWLVIPDDGFDPVAFMCQGDDATRSAVSIRKTITVNGYTFTYDASSEDWDTNEVDAFDADGEVRDWLTDNVDVAPPEQSYEDIFEKAYPDEESILADLDDCVEYYEDEGMVYAYAGDEEEEDEDEESEIPETARKITIEEAASLIRKGGITCANYD